MKGRILAKGIVRRRLKSLFAKITARQQKNIYCGRFGPQLMPLLTRKKWSWYVQIQENTTSWSLLLRMRLSREGRAVIWDFYGTDQCWRIRI